MHLRKRKLLIHSTNRPMNIVYPNLQINLSESGVREDYCVKKCIDMTVVSVIRLNCIQKL